jgi:hypothetical protein
MDSNPNSPERPAARVSGAQASPRACPRCGAAARRAEARFCSACGLSLDETYLPADALRASYNLQQGRTVNRSLGRASGKPPQTSKSSILSARNSNGSSTTALAFVTYSLVPYLGILFCPGALLMGGIGLYTSYRSPGRGGRRASYISLWLGLLIFCVQIFLWWLLYKIPEWAGR